MKLSTFCSLAILASTVYSHGILVYPRPRTAGPATAGICGKMAAEWLNTEPMRSIEHFAFSNPSSQPDHDPKRCNWYLCAGIQYESNEYAVQRWMVGEPIQMQIYAAIQHPGSHGNVSVVDTKTNKVVEGGRDIVYWASGYLEGTEDYMARDFPRDQTDFGFNVPDLGGACTVPGECVVQWQWTSKTHGQIYQSCVDFVIVKETRKRSRWMFQSYAEED